MNSIIDTIQKQNVPTQSACLAAQHLGLSGIGRLDSAEYVNRIEEITGEQVTFSDEHLYRLTYSYLVVEAIKMSENTDIMDKAVLLSTAKEKAIHLFENEPYHFATVETEIKLDASGKVKPKKGVKKKLAIQVYADFIKDKVSDRKSAIAILVEKVGLTPAGASTYLANLKRGTL